MLFGNLYQRKTYSFNMTCCFIKTNTVFSAKKAKKLMFVFVKKAKEKILLENCKCFFKREKIVLRAYFCRVGGSFPHPG